MRTGWLLVFAVVGATTLATAAPRRPQVRAPGFEMTGDGGSRVFVSLSSKVAVEERRAEGTITYVLKGTSVRARNNTLALVTEHFNTPVLRARLVPRGADLHLVVDLRAASAPTWRIAEGADGTAALQIDFPAGTFVTPEEPSAAPIPAPEQPEASSTLWRSSSNTAAPTDRRRARQEPLEKYREVQDRMRANAGPKDTSWRERARQAVDRPLPKQDPAVEERARALREKKRAERDAVHRQQQELDRPGGPGTAVTGN